MGIQNVVWPVLVLTTSSSEVSEVKHVEGLEPWGGMGHRHYSSLELLKWFALACQELWKDTGLSN